MRVAAVADLDRARPSAPSRLTLGVLIPTFRRPTDLHRCLDALAAQQRQADEVLLVVRAGDEETSAYLASGRAPSLPLRVVEVTTPGVVAALNAGISDIGWDVVAITDDDAAPKPDWLARIERHFLEDARLGGLGGRDRIAGLEQAAARPVVGRLQWHGRVVGNHHLGSGAPRDVDVLKGVNMSYRRAAIAGRRFDPRLRGEGAQVHCELDFSLRVKRGGWRLVYDPAVEVEHYLAPRFDVDQRDRYNPQALRNAVHNETLALLEHLRGRPLRQLVFLAWALAVGTRAAPGLLQVPRYLWWRLDAPMGRLMSCWRGRFEGWRTWRRPAATGHA